uniref:Uncharacterized protein n=1 Tax=Aegilops tauschii subsp. strangulata TaxID=200361 RepID=A0A453QGE3_AEGTS
MARSSTRSHGGAGAPTARSGGAPRRRTPTPSTASATCTVAATVQESLWNPSLLPLRTSRSSPSCPPSRPRPATPSLSPPSRRGLKPMACPSAGLARRRCTSTPRHTAAISSLYSLGAKSDVGELSFFSGASGNNNRGFTIDSPTDSSWHSMGSSLTPYQLSKPRDSGLMQGGFSYSHFEPSQELGQVTIASLSHSQEQDRRSFGGGGGGGGGGAGLMGNVKQENQPLRPFFDEWPGRRDSWSEMDDERSNGTSFSTTQLSISIPMPRCD